MRDKTWNDILHILCTAILVDGKVYKEEVDTFLAVSKHMNTQISDGMMLTDAMLMDWFQVHRDGIANDLETHVRGTYLKDQFCKIDDPKITGPLLRCILKIATADHNFHDLEISMVDMAASIWGWNLSELGD